MSDTQILHNHLADVGYAHNNCPLCQLNEAAPDLLKALKNMVSQFIRYTPHLSSHHPKCWELIQANAAIALAEKEGEK